MSVLTDKISKYLKISSEIATLENDLPNKKQEFEGKHFTNYNNLKSSLMGYISRIKPTVEIVCNLYRDTATLSNNKIRVSGEMLTQNFTPLNACEVARKAGNEGVNFLAAILKKVNVSRNLYEFAVRYNTVIDIFSSIETLKAQAISLELANYQAKIDALKAELQKICQDKKEFELLLRKMHEKSSEIYRRVFLQNTKTIEKDFITEIAIPIGYESCTVTGISAGEKDKVFVSSLDWNLHKDGILVIEADNEDIDSTALLSCTTNIITQFLFSYPLLSKKILLCDSCSSSNITSFAGILKNENNNLFYGNPNDGYVKNIDESIRISLSDLNKTIHQRIMTLGQSRCKNVLEYNHKNPDNPIELILVLLNGYPLKYEYAADDINSILKNGNDAGVFVLITENTYTDEETKFVRNRLPKLDKIENVFTFMRENQSSYLCKNSKMYSVDIRGENYNIRELLSAFKASKNSDSILYLDSVLDVETFANSERRNQYSKVLSVPFGKHGSNVITLNLDAKTTNAHLAVIGGTGSGKTGFLNTIVLSMCNLYSPKELELHMILMKKADFKIFMEQGLPHLKSLVTGDQISRANDVLDFIEAEMTRRGNLIGSYGNIYAYNEKALQPIPRCVIVIDEFYQLVEDNSDAIRRINTIAQTGRAYGISLVISAIAFPMDVRKIIPQFGNRFEFKAKENAGQLIPEVESRQSELSQGHCFFEQDDNLRFVTVAFSEEGDALKHQIDKIRNKYPNEQMTVQNAVTAVRISEEGDVPFTVKNSRNSVHSLELARGEYIDEQLIRVRLGKTDIYNDYLEYTFSEKNNLVFLFGDYLDTKVMEASLIKDVLVLSGDIEVPVVYYLDNNTNVNQRKKDTLIKRLKSSWGLSGKVVYGVHSDLENIFEDIETLIETRMDENSEIDLYPVLVVITKADELFSDYSMCDKICELISHGKDASIYFAIQCNEPVSFSDDSKYLKDAIIFPGRASDTMCDALESLPASQSEDGKKLLTKISQFGLDSKLHILCNRNKLSVFIPYEYDEEYLKNIIDLGDLL